MPKYFIPPSAIRDDAVTVTGDTAHHLLHVLRMKSGDAICLCDGLCTDYYGVIAWIHPKKTSLILNINKIVPCTTELPVQVALYQSMPKLDKMEWVIQKCVELGVHQIIPVITTRTVVRVKENETKTTRFQRIAEAAAGQSMRGLIPKVSPPTPFLQALETAQEEVLLAAYENEHTLTLRQALSEIRPASVGIWIGPEGGFTHEEVTAFRSHQAITVSLGPRILRTETAGLAALAHMACLWEEFHFGRW